MVGKKAGEDGTVQLLGSADKGLNYGWSGMSLGTVRGR